MSMEAPNWIPRLGIKLDPSRGKWDPRKRVWCYVVDGRVWCTTYWLGWTPKDSENRPSENLGMFFAEDQHEANDLMEELMGLSVDEARSRIASLGDRRVEAPPCTELGPPVLPMLPRSR